MCETWAPRSKDVHRLQLLEHRCLRSIGLSNKVVRHRIFSVQKQSRLDQIVLGTRM